MNIPRIEINFLLASSFSILRKTSQTVLLMWTWDACFYFVQMKRNTLGRKHMCCTHDAFSSAVGYMCVAVGITLRARKRGGRSRDEITWSKKDKKRDEAQRR